MSNRATSWAWDVEGLSPTQRIGLEGYTKLAFEEMELARVEGRQPGEWAVKECASEKEKMRNLPYEVFEARISRRDRSSPRRPKISKRKRRRVFAASEGACTYCKCALDEAAFHVDHVIPLSAGGPNSDGNLAASCAPCNLRKGARQ